MIPTGARVVAANAATTGWVWRAVRRVAETFARFSRARAHTVRLRRWMLVQDGVYWRSSTRIAAQVAVRDRRKRWDPR
jgi:hypothetical protein